MIEGFYSVCEPHLTRRRFLKFAMVAGMVPALTSRGYAARDTEAGVRRFIERYAVGPEVAAFGVQVLQEATQGLTPYATAGLPLTKKLPIHHFTCGGTHLCYSVLVAARHGLLRAAGGDIVQDQLRMLIYRLQADPELIDRYYRESSSAPGVDLFRAGAKLKVLGHALECLGYAQAHGLLQPSPPERTQIEQAAQEVRGLLSYVLTLDLAAIRRRHTQLAQQVVGDTCHAFRGLHLL